MLRTIKALLQLRVASAANRFVFYARKLPVVGGRIPEAVYARTDAKKGLAAAAIAFGALWGFANKFLYAGLFAFLPSVASAGGDGRLALFLHILLLLSFLTAGIAFGTALEPKREKYVAVKLMRMSPGAYMRTHFVYRYVTYFISYIPALMLYISLLGGSAAHGLALAAALTLWRVFCEYWHLKLFEKTGIVLIKQTAVVWLAIAAGLAAAYAPLFADGMPLLGGALRQWWALAAMAAAGLWAAAMLKRYPDYRAAVDAAMRRDDPLLDIGRMMTEAQQQNVKAKAADYDGQADLGERYGKLEGYAYLNALFFARHRSLFAAPVYKRLAAIAGLCVAGAFATAYFDDLGAAIAKNGLGAFLPYLILAMNFLAVGERACRAMFYHCDHSLMRYGFYRNAAPRHFRIRLVRLLGHNAALGAALAAALTVIVQTAGGAASADLIALWVVVLALSVFFSVHHLLLYYLLQPYSAELNVRNPFFFLANLGVSIAFAVSLIAGPPAAAFAAAVGAAALLYLAAAVPLVRKFGPRTFRVK